MDRPRNIAAGDTLSGGMRVLLTPAGERFKKMRRYVLMSDHLGFQGLTVFRALHAHLQPRTIVSYQPVLMRTAKTHILDIAADPEHHQEHAKRYVMMVAWSNFN